MSLGRYLSPEPLLQNPNWVMSELRHGFQVPTYGYARNNPMRYVDSTGLDAYVYDRMPWEGVFGHAGVAVEPVCRGDLTCRASVPVTSYDFFCGPWANGASSAGARCLYLPQQGTVFSQTQTVGDLAQGVQGRQYRVTVVPMSCEDTAALSDRLRSSTTSPPTYNAIANNCRDFVRSMVGSTCPPFYSPSNIPAGANGGPGRRF
jgi:hypothetical protein